MAIEYVGGKSVGFAGTTSGATISLTDLAGGLASSPADGDIVVVAFGVGTQGRSPTLTITDASDVAYTEVGTTLRELADDNDAQLAVFYKVVGSTPDTALKRGGTGNAADGGSVSIHVYRGVDATTPFDVTSTTATGINSSLPNPPAITPSTAGAVVVVAAAGTAPTLTTDWTTTGLSGVVQSVGTDTSDGRSALGYSAWTSGELDIAAFTGGGTTTDRSWAARTMALRPAPSSTVTGTGAVSIGAPTAASSGKLTFKGTAAPGAIGAPALAAAGTFTSPSAAGAGAVSIGAPSLASSGTVLNDVVGTGAVAIGRPTVLAAGSHRGIYSATGAVAIGAPGSSGSGAVFPPVVTGEISFAIGPPLAAATGDVAPPFRRRIMILIG